MISVTFPTCTVEWEEHNRRVVTRFPDGREAYAVAHETAEYRQHATDKGTGDIDLYAWMHDISHCIVAMIEHGGPSVVLRSLSLGLPTDTPECEAEEQAAQQFQRAFFLRS
jgi:hypothetical protein